MIKLIKIMAFVICLAVAPMSAHALTFLLDEVNGNNTGTNGPWASVTLTDTTVSGKDAVHFVVDPLEGSFSSLGTNFGLQSFYFNENTSFGNNLKIANFDPTGWAYQYNDSNAGGGFGKFEFLADGSGSNRANPLTFDVYTDANNLLTIADFSTILSSEGYLFAAHIADYNGGNSAKFATDRPSVPENPVPEPGTMMLLGFGMLGLAVYGKRRMNKNA